MFTGIVEELGRVKSLNKTNSIFKLQIVAPKISENVDEGGSVCVNGVCLTVVEIKKKLLCFDIMPETIKCTNLKQLKPAQPVNLERALRIEGRLDGHFVTGHIDGIGIIAEKKGKKEDIEIKIETNSEQILRYIVLKGSLTLDGVSLTVSKVEKNSFTVNLIPYTVKNTTFGFKEKNDEVNIECDILAKYTQRLLFSRKNSSTSNITLSFLQEHGFAP